MEFVRTLLEQQPLMTLFLTIAIGYLVGEVNIKGFSLGVGAVLFVALAIGWFAPKAAPAPMVGTLGLALFLYSVGVQYGQQFLLGLTLEADAHVGAEDDVVFVVGPNKEAVEQTRKPLGEAAPGRVFKDRSDLDYQRVFASRPSVVGRAIGDLELPSSKGVVIAQIRRGD